MPSTEKPALSYESAGVNIETGNEFVQRIKPIAAKTTRPEVLAGLGGFGALFELPWQRYKQPILVSSTDGVGTKLKLAVALNQHNTIGIDLVAMCVNDLVVQGAEPLFFLDYFASGQLDLATATAVMQGIGKGCELAGAALIGGETAEMPGIYQNSDYDLAGFTVGIVEKSQLIDGSSVKAGDVVLGLASSGVHSNGFSLVRKILEQTESSLAMPFENSTLGETLLRPTRIYVKPILSLLKKINVHAIAHITGGGLIENLPRVLPPYLSAHLKPSSWQQPAIFAWLKTAGNLQATTLYRTFNCGIGMTLCVAPTDVAATIDLLQQAGETVWPIGTIVATTTAKPQVIFVDES